MLFVVISYFTCRIHTVNYFIPHMLTVMLLKGGGLWMPEAAALTAIRENINERPHDIKGVLMNRKVQEEFFPGTLGKETQTIKAFAAKSAENALKTKPKVSNLLSVSLFNPLEKSLVDPLYGRSSGGSLENLWSAISNNSSPYGLKESHLYILR